MATVIDELVVVLGLDPKDFDRGRKKAGEDFLKYKKDTESQAKDMGEFFSQLRGNVLALYAAFTAGKGIKEFVSSVITTDATVGRLAYTLDQQIERLSAWRGAAVLTGGTADGITASIQGLVSQFQTFSLTGESSVIPYFRALGVDIADANGKMRDTGDILLDLSDKLHGMDPARAAAFGQALGFDQGTINLLIQGRSAVQGMLDEQKKLGVITKEDAAAGMAMQKSIAELDQASTTAGRTILTILAPALIAVLNAVRDVTVWLTQHKPILVAVFAAITVAVLALSAAMFASLAKVAVAAVIDGFTTLIGIGPILVSGIGLVADAFVALSTAILATPLGWIIAGIAALSFAGYELYEHWDAIGKWWSDLWHHMRGDADPNLFEDAFAPKSSPDKSAWGKDQRDQSVNANSGMGRDGRDQSVNAESGWGGLYRSKPPQGAFNKDAWAAARTAEGKYGVPARVTYAQWALESGYGQHMPTGSNNPFGIKARDGEPYAEAMTTEVVNGQSVRMMQKFAKYRTLADAFEAHARLLAYGKPYARARQAFGDPDRYANMLTGTYATDPNYGNKLKAIMHGIPASRRDFELANNDSRQRSDAQGVTNTAHHHAGASNDSSTANHYAGDSSATHNNTYNTASNTAHHHAGATANTTNTRNTTYNTNNTYNTARNGAKAPIIPPSVGAKGVAVASNITNNAHHATQHTTTSETKIGTVVVNTKATDAKGIAKDIKSELAQSSYATQANYGAA